MIEIQNIELTPLDPFAFQRVVARFFRIPRDLVLIFDPKMSEVFGLHWYEAETKTHYIKIAAMVNRYTKHGYSFDLKKGLIRAKLKKLTNADAAWEYVSTTLHEMRHAHQCQKNPQAPYSRTFCQQDGIRSEALKTYYSESERDARNYETTRIVSAMQYYFEMVELGKIRR